MENFNNFFQQQFWNSNKNFLHQQPPNVRGEISSSEKGAMANSILAPSKLAQAQPPHSTNRDLTSLSLDNRHYLDGLRQSQQARQNSFTNGTLTISPASGGSGSSRDNNNNGLNSQSISFAREKLINRLDIDTIRSNINSHRSVGSCGGASNLIHHQHGTILFNTLNGGALGAGSNGLMQGTADCFNGPDLVDSTTPPPTAISMPPASSASSSSSTISTNLGLNRNSSQEGITEKIKTPNSIRGELLGGWNKGCGIILGRSLERNFREALKALKAVKIILLSSMESCANLWRCSFLQFLWAACEPLPTELFN